MWRWSLIIVLNLDIVWVCGYVVKIVGKWVGVSVLDVIVDDTDVISFSVCSIEAKYVYNDIDNQNWSK